MERGESVKQTKLGGERLLYRRRDRYHFRHLLRGDTRRRARPPSTSPPPPPVSLLPPSALVASSTPTDDRLALSRLRVIEFHFGARRRSSAVFLYTCLSRASRFLPFERDNRRICPRTNTAAESPEPTTCSPLFRPTDRLEFAAEPGTERFRTEIAAVDNR